VPLDDVTIRPAVPDDLDALVGALLHAVNWDAGRAALDRPAVLADPHLAHYVVGWPGPGEPGVVATVDGAPIGAAWLRRLPAEDPGYGFVAADVPEFSVGVDPQHRGRGVGRALLRRLLAEARAQGVRRVSLSVERANPARNLYLSEGFVVVGGTDDADTMVVELQG
jgi:ribosomal protein S18 acetylase RimI-like enzyme